MRYDDLPSRDYDEVVVNSVVAFLTEKPKQEPFVRLVSDNPEKNVLLISDPAAVRAVITDYETFDSQNAPQAIRFDSDFTPETACIYARSGFSLKPILPFSDGPYHQRVRRIVQAAFSEGRVAQKTPYMRALVKDMIEPFARGGTVDFVRQFAFRFPSSVITKEYGLGLEHVDLMLDITHYAGAMIASYGPPGRTEAAAPVVVKLMKLIVDRMEHEDELPEFCLLRDLIAAMRKDQLSREELLWLSIVILSAAAHTTGAGISWSLFMLASRPDMQARLRANPAEIDLFVDEVLRLHPPTVTSYRHTTRDSEICGVEIPKGTWVALRHDAYNASDKIFADADTLNIDRDNIRAHLSFGVGKHFCVGINIAKREIALTVEEVLRSFASIEFAQDPGTIKLVPNFDYHALAELPLRLTPVAEECDTSSSRAGAGANL